MRSIEIADARRGYIDKAYQLKPKGKAMLFESMVQEYLKWSKENKKSWETDFYRCKALIKAFKGKLMSDINAFMIEKFKMARAKEVTKQSINIELILGNQISQKAIEWKKYSGENPFAKANKFKIPKAKKPGSLSLEQVQAIMAEIPHPVKHDMVEFAFYTGWRISEIRKLKWQDVDLKNGLACIIDPKNSQDVEIELNDSAIETIRKQKKRCDYVFCALNGKPYKSNMNMLIRGAAYRAGVYLPPRKAWHILRRTWASNMLQSGCDVETLRELGNWKTHAMPLWYADAANRKQKKELLNRLPKLEPKICDIFVTQKRQKTANNDKYVG